MSVNPFESPHFKAVSAIYPLQTDEEHYAFGKEMDRLKAATDDVLVESIPNTCTEATLQQWEKVYDLSGVGTFEERRQKLVAAYNAQSGITKRHYESLAQSIGYDVVITPPPKVFRVGVSRIGEKLYDEDEVFTWTIETVSLIDPRKLIEIFSKNSIPFTRIRWIIKMGMHLVLEDGKHLMLEDGRFFITEDTWKDTIFS